MIKQLETRYDGTTRNIEDCANKINEIIDVINDKENWNNNRTLGYKEGLFKKNNCIGFKKETPFIEKPYKLEVEVEFENMIKKSDLKEWSEKYVEALKNAGHPKPMTISDLEIKFKL